MFTALRQASGERAAGGGQALAPASVGFPAGWDTGRPWFLAGPARAGAALPVKPPPPPFPAQPVQGSRLGPLPPVGLFAQRQSRPLTSAATNAAAAAAAPPDPAEICPPKPCAAAAARPDAAAAAAPDDAACATGAPAKAIKPSAGPGSGPSSASTAVDSESTAAAVACEAGGGGGSRAASGSAAATDSICLDRSGYAGSGSGGASGSSKAPGACPDAGAASARAPAAQPSAADTGAPSEAGVQPAGADAAHASEGATAPVATPLPGATPRSERVHRRLGDGAYQRLRGEVLAQHAQHREQARPARERGSIQSAVQPPHPCVLPLMYMPCFVH